MVCFGGDEFVFVLLGVMFEMVYDLVECLCKKVFDLELGWGDEYDEWIILSIGVVFGILDFDDIGFLIVFLKVVDEVCYCVKE